MAALRKRKDRSGIERFWELDWSDAKGRHRLTLGEIGVLEERKANDILRAKQVELSTGTRILGITRSHVPTFEQYAHDYLIWHQAEYPSSNERIAQIVWQHLVPRFGQTPLDMIAESEAEHYKQARRPKAKANTIVKEVRTLKAIINRAVLTRVITENPILHVNGPKVLDAKPHYFYEDSDLVPLYAACSAEVNAGEGPQPNPLHAAIWKLFANTGMRRGEGAQLKLRWIGADGIKIISTGEERTKSGDWREVPKTVGAAEAIDRLKGAGEDGYLLPRITKPSLSRGFARDAKRAGIPGSLHTLRHTYISRLVRDTNVPMRTVQIYAGHSSIAVTEQYLYLRDRLAETPAAALNL